MMTLDAEEESTEVYVVESLEPEVDPAERLVLRILKAIDRHGAMGTHRIQDHLKPVKRRVVTAILEDLYDRGVLDREETARGYVWSLRKHISKPE